MPKQMKHKLGFTLIEVLMTIGLISAIASVSAPLMRSFLLGNNGQTTLDTLLSFVTQAQSYSLAGMQDAQWGVCLQNNQLWLITNTCSIANQQAYYQLPTSTTINYFDTFLFNKRGELSSPASISLITQQKTKTVSINQLGAIDVE